MVGAVNVSAMVHHNVLKCEPLPAITTAGTTIGKSAMREQGQLECMTEDARTTIALVDSVIAMVNRCVNERIHKQK